MNSKKDKSISKNIEYITELPLYESKNHALLSDISEQLRSEKEERKKADKINTIFTVLALLIAIIGLFLK